MADKVSRRKFLRGLGAAAAAATAAACQPQTVIVKETVEVAVDREVTKVVEVEKEVVVKETVIVAGTPQVVERVVTPTMAPTPTLQPGGWRVNFPPFAKYDPIKGFTRPRSVGSNRKYIEQDTVEYHAGDRLTEEKLGIRWKPKFISSGGGEYREKLNLAMAANDLPDFFSVYPFDVYGQMVQAGVIKDVTDLWEEHASDFMKEFYSWGNGILWEPIVLNGRFYGTPLIKVVGQDEKQLWYRTDWFEKIGATEPPKTIEELHDYAVELVAAKAAGDDRPTIGLPLNQELNTWITSTDPIFGAYGVMPEYWKLMDDGTVENYSTMETTKEVLSMLHDWYEEGLIYAEFFTVNASKSTEVIINGQAGMYFGPYWCPRWPNGDALSNDKARGIENAAWQFAEIPTGPAGRGTKFTLPVQGAFAAAATVSDEDWVAALKAWEWTQLLSHPMYSFDTKWHGFEGYDYRMTADGCELVPELESVGIPNGFGRPDVLVQEREYQYREMLKEKYDAGGSDLDCVEKALVEATFVGGEAARYQQTREAYRVGVDAAANYAIGSAFNGIPTPTMVEEAGNLRALERAAFIDIIVGNQPISFFDTFVQEYKAGGGDAIAAEIAEYLASQ